MEKIVDLTMLSDIFPTGFHGAKTAGIGPGDTAYIAGAGPVGLAAAHSAQLLGASVVIVGDLIPERLEQARSFGCETIDVSKGDPGEQIEQLLGTPEVDGAVDAVGFEARGHGADADHEAPATVLNSVMTVTRAAGKLGIPGLYVTGDPGAIDDAAKEGSLSIRIGLGWAKSPCSTRTGRSRRKRPSSERGHRRRRARCGAPAAVPQPRGLSECRIWRVRKPPAGLSPSRWPARAARAGPPRGGGAALSCRTCRRSSWAPRRRWPARREATTWPPDRRDARAGPRA
jgi:hypothetical protein